MTSLSLTTSAIFYFLPCAFGTFPFGLLSTVLAWVASFGSLWSYDVTNLVVNLGCFYYSNFWCDLVLFSCPLSIDISFQQYGDFFFHGNVPVAATARFVSPLNVLSSYIIELRYLKMEACLIRCFLLSYFCSLWCSWLWIAFLGPTCWYRIPECEHHLSGLEYRLQTPSL